MPRRTTALEDLDDDHATAAAWTSRLAGIDGSSGRLTFRFCNGKQLTGARDVVGAGAFGEQAVVADAVQAFWQHVDEEAADELEGPERDLLVSIATLDAIILPLERDAALVKGDQATVGDGDAVGVTRQISDYTIVQRYTRERISYWLCRPAALELRRSQDERNAVCLRRAAG